MKLLLSIGVLFASIAPGCAGSSLSPYTAAQWRAATQDGRTYRYRIEVPRNPELHDRELVFEGGGAHGAYLKTTTYLEDGLPAVGQRETARLTWAQLVHKTRYPRAFTEVRQAYIETPGGNFDARLYIVRQQTRWGHLKVTRAWFADALPGAPVRHEIEIDGKVVSRLVFVHRSDGDLGPPESHQTGPDTQVVRTRGLVILDSVWGVRSHPTP